MSLILLGAMLAFRICEFALNTIVCVPFDWLLWMEPVLLLNGALTLIVSQALR